MEDQLKCKIVRHGRRDGEGKCIVHGYGLPGPDIPERFRAIDQRDERVGAGQRGSDIVVDLTADILNGEIDGCRFAEFNDAVTP